jgi:hypothetical protein
MASRSALTVDAPPPSGISDPALMRNVAFQFCQNLLFLARINSEEQDV